MKLGTLLLRDAVISLSQLEAALRTQVLYGGRLGTNLVELDFIDLTTLGSYLSAILGVPVASAEHFEQADQTLLQEFGAELADLYTAIPLGMDPDNPEKLAVALANPRNGDAIAQLSVRCGYPIQPYVAAELRIYYYLEKYYGIERKARYVRTGTQRHTPGHVDERRVTHAPRGLVMPPPVTFAPKHKRAKTDPGLGEPAPGEDHEEPAAEPTAPEPRHVRREPRVSYATTIDAISEASHRNDIGDALIAYADGRFGVAVVFLLRDQNALGWRYYSASGAGSFEKVEHLALPLGGTSVLQAAHDSAKPYRGDSPSAGMPIERELWDAVEARAEPKDMLVVPITVKSRVVNLIYVHGVDGGPIPDHLADELVELALRCSDAYVRLIQAIKAAARAENAGD
jgi:hypothetical protein